MYSVLHETGREIDHGREIRIAKDHGEIRVAMDQGVATYLIENEQCWQAKR